MPRKATLMFGVIIFVLASVNAGAQDWDKDPNIEAAGVGQVVEPSDAPIKVHELKISWSGRTLRWSSNSEKVPIFFRFRVVAFNIWRKYVGTWYFDVKADLKNRVKNQQNQFWLDHNLVKPSYRTWGYYTFIIPERVLFSDFEIWERQDDGVFDVIFDQMGVQVPKDLDEDEIGDYIRALKEIISKQ